MASYWAMLRSVDLGCTRRKAGDVKVRRHGVILGDVKVSRLGVVLGDVKVSRHGIILIDRSVSIESYTRRCQG